MNIRVTCLFFLLIISSPFIIFAQENTVPLYIEPVYPSNQVDGVRGYFHLNVEPGQDQTVTVKLKNNLDEDLKVRMEPANGYSNPSGGMLYSRELQSDKSKLLNQAIKLADHISLDSEVTLEPKETREVTIDITVPNMDIGTALGGIRFVTEGTPKEESSDAEEGEANFILKTEIANAVAIQLDFPNRAHSNFQLENVGFSPEGPSVYSIFKNAAGLIQENISGQYRVEDSSGNQLFNGEIPSFKMAPFTQIRYPMYWDYETLEEGSYKLFLTMNVDGKEITSEEEFSIGDEEINKYVERTQPTVTTHEDNNRFPSWIWFAIGGVVLAGGMYWLGMRKR
ncbi:Protein of unknown function C-terminal [Oceanobacillus limi]|uniref:Uncharacterized protein n=1 Tax=Oceanobacillus limi TaxID=930131 RepID=A0A1I0D5P3_9BACI|nr:DUF916 domain-containing protein [Oceanobacillus limi]SET27152.1 Protein of unknown function C-terminal [Oceanobacillus limi]